MIFDVTLKTEINVCSVAKFVLLSLSFRHFGVRRVNMSRNIRFMDSYVLNKRAKFGAKIFTNF